MASASGAATKIGVVAAAPELDDKIAWAPAMGALIALRERAGAA